MTNDAPSPLSLVFAGPAFDPETSEIVEASKALGDILADPALPPHLRTALLRNVRPGLYKGIELEKERGDLWGRAYLDPQGTGAPSRLFFLDHLARSLAETKRTLFNATANDNIEPKALLFIDIVGLNEINKKGQDVGDKAILALAHALKRIVRPDEMYGRVGGDEFIIEVHGNIEGAVARFEKELGELTYEHEGQVYPIRIYVAAFEEDTSLTAQENYDRAARLLADAKEAAGIGRNANAALAALTAGR